MSDPRNPFDNVIRFELTPVQLALLMWRQTGRQAWLDSPYRPLVEEAYAGDWEKAREDAVALGDRMGAALKAHPGGFGG